MATSSGKFKQSTEPTHLQTRTAVNAHLAEEGIGREMLETEYAVVQAQTTPKASMPPPPPKVTPALSDRERSLRIAVGNYYKHHFPYEEVWRLFSRQWVPAGPAAHMREYGWEGIGGSPFVRWKSCTTAQALHEMVSGSDVGKLNVGAMFNADPSNRYKEREPMVPRRRELVIDIDLDDYGGISKDDLRASDMNWPLVAVGLEVVRQVLKEGFGFQHVLAVYSGRRGGHLWVCDERACCMDDQARAAIVQFLQPSEGKGKKWWVDLVRHPNFKDISANLMVPYFRTVCVKAASDGGLGMFELAFQRKAFLALMHESIGKRLESEVCEVNLPEAALDLIEAYCKSGPAWRWEAYQTAIWEMIGPRIDANVSKHANHTLKSPYSVHPKTGRISVPVLHDRLDQFPVAARAPMVNDMMGSHPDVSKDTLMKSVEAFARFIDRVAASETEKWVAPNLAAVGPPSKRAKIVHDMKGPMEDTSTEPTLADYPRNAIKMQRDWTVVPSETPGMMSLYTSVHASISDLVTIRAGQYPPFEHEYGQGSVETIASQIAHAAVQGNQDNLGQLDYALHGGSKKFIMVINDGERDFANPKTHEYASKMCSRLKERVKVADLNIGWGDDSLQSFIRQQISAFVTDLYSPRPPRPPHAPSSSSSDADSPSNLVC
jgi:DNA primase small subunit